MGTKRTKERGTARSSPAADQIVVAKDAARTDGEPLAELRRLTEYRSLMLATLAHDLRTPLTAILGFAEILVDFEELTESQKGLCERIQNSGRELQSTINLLSDLARLDLADTAIVPREFALPPKLNELCEGLSRKAKKKNVSLICRVEDGAGTVVSDESKLRQVLYNFLGWAIARSPEGGQVVLAASVNAAGALEVRIIDEGESLDVTGGFDPPGAGGDQSTLLGIGLNVSQRLAATLGASVTLEGREPQGLSILLQLSAGTVGGGQILP
jgi:two-component system, NarL family, sensor histidine kinase BarA